VKGHFYEAKWLRKLFVSVPRLCRGANLWSMKDGELQNKEVVDEC